MLFRSLAIAEADVIVFVVDAEVGATPADEEAAALLRSATAPVLVAANIAQLHDTHRIERCALFDQFPYTHHMESGVLLVRK